jgi:membrane protein
LKEKFAKIFDFFDDDTPYYAASLSFFTIFSILPLIALLIVIVSKVPAVSEHMDLMTSYIFDFINPTHSKSMINTLTRFLENTDKLGNIGIFYLLFVFTMFFKDYEHIINKIYGTPARAVYTLFFMYLGFMILIPVLFIVFIFVSTLPYLKVTFVTQLITFIFIWNIFILLFILSANTKVTYKAAAAGSLITLITLSVTKKLFAFYVESNSTYATIYGSFSVALIFFLWIYVSWNIYLYGTKLCSILNSYELNNKEKKEDIENI